MFSVHLRLWAPPMTKPLESQILAFLPPLPWAHCNPSRNPHGSWRCACLEEGGSPSLSLIWFFPLLNPVDSRSHRHQDGARNDIPKTLTLPGKPGWYQDPGVGENLKVGLRETGRKGRETRERRQSRCWPKINPYEPKIQLMVKLKRCCTLCSVPHGGS